MAEKKLPVGIEYFSEIITDGYYYVDKTGLINFTEYYGAAESLVRCGAPE